MANSAENYDQIFDLPLSTGNPAQNDENLWFAAACRAYPGLEKLSELGRDDLITEITAIYRENREDVVYLNRCEDGTPLHDARRFRGLLMSDKFPLLKLLHSVPDGVLLTPEMTLGSWAPLEQVASVDAMDEILSLITPGVAHTPVYIQKPIAPSAMTNEYAGLIEEFIKGEKKFLLEILIRKQRLITLIEGEVYEEEEPSHPYCYHSRINGKYVDEPLVTNLNFGERHNGFFSRYPFRSLLRTPPFTFIPNSNPKFPDLEPDNFEAYLRETYPGLPAEAPLDLLEQALIANEDIAWAVMRVINTSHKDVRFVDAQKELERVLENQFTLTKQLPSGNEYESFRTAQARFAETALSIVRDIRDWKSAKFSNAGAHQNRVLEFTR